MPECDYCGEAFDGEDAYLDHLGSAHEGELSAIDQRRVAGHVGDGESSFPLGPAVLVGLFVFAGAVVVYVTFLMGGGGGGSGVVNTGPWGSIQVEQMPGEATGQLDYHGYINVTIAGEQVDFSRDRYQLNDQRFHFEAGNGQIWHGHADGITLEFAMATVGIDLNESAVTYQGQTYRESDPGTEVIIRVNGESVDPTSYVLDGTTEPENGDRVRIVVRTDGS